MKTTVNTSGKPTVNESRAQPRRKAGSDAVKMSRYPKSGRELSCPVSVYQASGGFAVTNPVREGHLKAGHFPASLG
jgi:hypothetical protein